MTGVQTCALPIYATHGLEDIGEGAHALRRGVGDDVGLMIVDESGQFVTTDSFKYCSRVIHHELRLAFDFHALRHTHATMLIEGGASVKSVQTRLGHENVKTTLQTYVHDTDVMADEAVDVFERALSTTQS